ncbi:hypothetical protein CKO31_17990 [Thiohalocapsa halophila]|uniref:Uncharacterized protein n=1 Tax=Thiohalocapsa halophila TaxID=69359 RepID=A0ABS1CKY2_9GAMM|nr:hypothetical protein [Thiohalocapsa halophila]MBK1632598.1 hypothetical protein [Thiohalocapsa halophila]
MRRISLLKDRSDRYPLRVGNVDEYGILERSVLPFAGGVERSPVPGERFTAALDARLDASASKDVYIYVHGYKVDYENPVLVGSDIDRGILGGYVLDGALRVPKALTRY